MASNSRRIIVPALGVAALALVVAACGGGEATATPTAAPRPTATAVPAAATPAPEATPTTAPAPTAAAATATPTAPPPTATPAPTATSAPRATSTPAPPSATPGRQPRYGGTLQARVHTDWPIWDTYNAVGGFSAVFAQELLSNLVRYKKDSISAIEGDAAENWDVSADGKTYTFRLRRDIKWSDGKPLTSADVLYNLRRASDPKTIFNKEKVARIDATEAPDDYTVRITLKAVSASFLPAIATPFILIYPASIPDMAAWQKAPVTSGAFMFKEYNKGTSYVFVKNPNYYWKDGAGGQMPYLDGIVYTVIADKGFALAALRSGRLHCGCGYDSDFMTGNKDEILRSVPGVKLTQAYGSFQAVQPNVTRPPWNNLAFRQALAIGFDKAKVASIHLNGVNYTPASLFIPPELGGQWGLPKSELVKYAGYRDDHNADLAVAQQKFKESGIDPKTIQAELTSVTFYGTEPELMATVLSELGLKIAAKIYGVSAERTAAVLRGDFNLNHLPLGLSIDDPADLYMSALLSDGSQNYGKYVNRDLDRMLLEQDAILDPVKRRAILWDVQKIVLTDVPLIPFIFEGRVNGTRPEVFNYHTPILPVHAAYRLDDLWLEQ